MKKIKILGLIALMLTSSLVNTGCPTCKDTLALCDLAIKAFTAPIDAVFVGQAFDAVSNISNQEKGGECTTTEIAASTANLLEVLLKDNAGNWNLLNSKSDISQQALSPGDEIALLQNLSLNQAGEYRLDYYDDHLNSVDERDENNNYSSLGGKSNLKYAIRQTNNFASVHITVLPLPDGTTQIKDRPIVEFH